MSTIRENSSRKMKRGMEMFLAFELGWTRVVVGVESEWWKEGMVGVDVLGWEKRTRKGRERRSMVRMLGCCISRGCVECYMIQACEET